MPLRELLNVYYARLMVGRAEDEMKTLDRQLNVEPGKQAVPVSTGTKALMALLGMQPRPSAEAKPSG